MNETERPDFSEILDWLEGRLSQEAAEALVERMARAAPEARAQARADEDWLRSFLEDLAASAPQPPARVRENLRQQFQQYKAGNRPGLFARIQAVLSFDSGWQLAAAGLRSAGSENQQRHLIYNTELAEIALSIGPGQTGDHLTLFGQVFPLSSTAPKDFNVQLLKNSVEVGLAIPDELGEFTIRDVPWGEYDLLVSVDEAEILIPALSFEP